MLLLAVLCLVGTCYGGQGTGVAWNKKNCNLEGWYGAVKGNVTDAICAPYTQCDDLDKLSFRSYADKADACNRVNVCMYDASENRCKNNRDHKNNVCAPAKPDGTPFNINPICHAITKGVCPRRWQVKQSCCTGANAKYHGILLSQPGFVCCNKPCEALQNSTREQPGLCRWDDHKHNEQCGPSGKSVFGSSMPPKLDMPMPPEAVQGMFGMLPSKSMSYGIESAGFGFMGMPGPMGAVALEEMGVDRSKDKHIDEITADDVIDTLISSLDNDKEMFDWNRELTSDPWFGKDMYGGPSDMFKFIDPTLFLKQIYGSPFGLSQARLNYGNLYGFSSKDFKNPKPSYGGQGMYGGMGNYGGGMGMYGGGRMDPYMGQHGGRMDPYMGQHGGGMGHHGGRMGHHAGGIGQHGGGGAHHTGGMGHHGRAGPPAGGIGQHYPELPVKEPPVYQPPGHSGGHQGSGSVDSPVYEPPAHSGAHPGPGPADSPLYEPNNQFNGHPGSDSPAQYRPPHSVDRFDSGYPQPSPVQHGYNVPPAYRAPSPSSSYDMPGTFGHSNSGYRPSMSYSSQQTYGTPSYQHGQQNLHTGLGYNQQRGYQPHEPSYQPQPPTYQPQPHQPPLYQRSEEPVETAPVQGYQPDTSDYGGSEVDQMTYQYDQNQPSGPTYEEPGISYESSAAPKFKDLSSGEKHFYEELLGGDYADEIATEYARRK